MATEQENRSEFEKIGAPEVRRKLILDAYQGNNKKHAELWLAEKKEDKKSQRERLSKIATKAAIAAAIISATTAIIGAICTIVSMYKK